MGLIVQHVQEIKRFSWNEEKTVFFALHQIFVGHDTHHVMGKAVNGDAVVDDIIPHFPAKTGIFGNQLLDVLEAVRVFGVLRDRSDAVAF